MFNAGECSSTVNALKIKQDFFFFFEKMDFIRNMDACDLFREQLLNSLLMFNTHNDLNCFGEVKKQSVFLYFNPSG